MGVTYARLDFASRDHEHVSREWYYLLHDLHEAGVRFNVNEGHRTMERQAQLVREKGVWSASNPTGAARPSSVAPHIRTGKPSHAIDFDNAPAVVAAAAKRGVRLYRPIPTEPWHVDPDAGDLARYARKHRAARAKARAKAKAAAARKAAAKARAKVAPIKGVSSKGLGLIKRAEGLRLVAYKPVASERFWTIGYGHYGSDVRKGQRITPAQADAFLKRDVAWAVAATVAAFKRYGIKPTRGEFDATVSFVFNSGAGVLDPERSFGGALKRRNLKAAADSLRLYVHDAGGRKLQGLVDRREAERKLFLTR